MTAPSLPPALEKIAREMDAECLACDGHGKMHTPAMLDHPDEIIDCPWPGHAKAREVARKAAEEARKEERLHNRAMHSFVCECPKVG